MSSTNHEIDRMAAHWAAKRDLGGLTPGEEAEFERWLRADTRHLGAYGRAEAVLGRLERFKTATLGSASSEAPPELGWTRRRILLTGGAAAGILAVVGTGLIPRGARRQTLSTEIGQMREVILSDGSVVSLNTNSEITVHFTSETRSIDLLRGEVLFDVAKNRRRPFVVSAGDTRVRAVGTSFTVSRLPLKPIQVLVKEGVVELERSNVPDLSPVRATANIQAIAPPNAPIVTVPIPEQKLDRDLEWQHGRIALDDVTLQDAASEFARYSEVRVIVDPAISEKTVTGLFASNDPVGFAKAAASVLKLRVEVDGSEVRLFAD